MSKHKEICLFWCSGVQQYPITMSGIQFDLKSFRCKVSDLMLPSDQWRPKGMTWRDHVATFSHLQPPGLVWDARLESNPKPAKCSSTCQESTTGLKKSIYIYYNGKTQCLRMAAMPICKQCLLTSSSEKHKMEEVDGTSGTIQYDDGWRAMPRFCNANSCM